MDCRIRKWRIEDAEDIAAVISNEKIQDNLRDGIPYPYTVDDARKFITSMLNADANTTFAFAVTVNDKAVGSISVFRGSNIHARTAEIGYYISEEYWGKGIMPNAIRQACAFVFDNTDIIRIYAEPFAYNHASARALEKAGFEYEGTLHKNAIKNGKIIDMKMYALVRD